MTEISSEKIKCDACEIHYLKTGASGSASVILLHGMKFQATTWQELGTLEIIAEAGFQAIALDMPGFGKSPACSSKQDSVLASFLQGMGLNNIVLIGPSMGGRISLEFTINHPDMVDSLVLVGAVGVEENKDRLSSINIPTLLVWGEDDQISPLTNCDLLYDAIPGAQKIIIEGATHPCYLDKPDIWHSELIRFLNSLTD